MLKRANAFEKCLPLTKLQISNAYVVYIDV